jgi:PAS domain S-box-containing protein
MVPRVTSGRPGLLAAAAASVAPMAAVAADALHGEGVAVLAAVAVGSAAMAWFAIRRLVASAVGSALREREAEHQVSLHLSETLFEQKARAAPTGIFRLDSQFRLTYANPWCLDLMGRSEEEMRALGLAGCIHPEDRPWVLEMMERARTRDVELDLPECRILRPDGTVVWVLVRDALERDAARRVSGRVGTVVDVTTLKQTTEALRESDERFRKLARIAPVGIFRTDPEGGCTYANEALVATLRLPPDQLRGLDWRSLVHPHDRSKLDRLEGAVPRELRLRRPDGREVWVLVREVTERDRHGNVLGHIGTLFDITGQIMAREALRMSEERFRVALKHSPVMVFAQDLDFRFTWVFNAPPGADGLLGNTINDHLMAEDVVELAAIKREVLTTQCSRRHEIAGNFQGGERCMDVWYEPMLDEQGVVTGLVGAALDITEERKLQAALRLAREEAERANEAKSRFLAAASHDLRQPFQAMRLFRSALTPWLADPKAAAVTAKLDEAMTAGEQLLTALLDVSTLEAGIVTPNFGRIAAEDIVERLVREFQPQAASQGLTLKHHIRPGAVVTDSVLLERILRNLLHNAVRYTERGGILIATRRRGGHLLFQVWDTGMGIPADKQLKVFEDFYQVGNPGRDRSRGLGLGLSVVARTARLLGHEVALSSREGRGSVFTVSVKLADCPAQAAA